MEDYIKINKAAWEKRTEVHLRSEMYDFEAFMNGESSLSPLDYELLGNLKGKSILHLQCHFGMDTLSISRDLKPDRIVGIDLSDSAIAKAKELNTQLNLNAEFITCDIYELPRYLSGQFDVVYTSYGVIDWLKDLNKWGEIIHHFLKPDGRFVMVEFHPMLWMFGGDLKTIQYAYSREEPYVALAGTYTENGSESISQTVNWSHSLSEPVNALAKNGLRIQSLKEYYYSPVNLFGKMKKTGEKEYKLPEYEDMVPLIYSVTAGK